MASISLEYIVSILQWSRRLSTMGKFWMSNPMPEQYKAVIPLFLKNWWQTDSILAILWINECQFPSDFVRYIIISPAQLTQFLSLSSQAFYGTLLPPLSFANSDLRYVYFYSKCNSEEPQQNSITTWNSYSWYLRKIIQSLNYEEKSWQVKVWKVLI